MKIYNRVVISMATGQVLSREGFEYAGPIATCKGASKEEKAAAASTMNLNTAIQQSMSTYFANQQSVLQTITSAFKPILDAGPGQTGFSAGERAALKTSVMENNAQQYANAKRAMQGTFASRGGGNEVLPSGVEVQAEGALSADTAAKTAAGLTNVDIADYQQGNQNFQLAAQALGGVANQEGSGYSTATGGAAKTSELGFEQQSKITQENDAASPWAMVGGILGSVSGDVAGAYLPGTEKAKSA